MGVTLPNGLYAPAFDEEGWFTQWATSLGILDNSLWAKNPLNYGAVGLGTTDDTAAIQDAIDAAGTGVVVVPPGIFSATSLSIASNYAHFVGAGEGITTIKGRTGATKLLDVTGTDVVIENMTIDGNGIATYGIFAETLAVRGTARLVEVIGCTTAGVANVDQNHSWSFDRCHIHLNTGRGVIWIKRGQNTRFTKTLIYANTLGQVQLGEGTTAMGLITFTDCMVQATVGFAGVPNFQVSSQINPLILRGTYCECWGAAGTDITVDAGLSVSTVILDGHYSIGNAVALYEIVLNSQTYLMLKDLQGTGFVTGNVNDATTTSRIFHINSNENGSVRVPFQLDRMNLRLSVVTLTDAGTVTVDPRLGRYFILSTANSRAFGAPSGPVDGMEITIETTNTGGSPITPTYNPVYKLVGNAGPTIGPGKMQSVTFYYRAALVLWIEKHRTSGDI